MRRSGDQYVLETRFVADPAKRVSLGEGQHRRARVLGQPGGTRLVRGKEIHIPAEGAAKVGPVPGRLGHDEGHHHAHGVGLLHPFRRHGEADVEPGNRTGRRNAPGAIQKFGKEEAVEGAPSIKAAAADRESVACG